MSKNANMKGNKIGQLSKVDLLNELNSSNGIKIYLGLGDDDTVKNRVQAASYDITPSIVAMSVKKGFLETVYKSNSVNINSYYIYVRPKDTVLIVSNEFISLPQNVAAYVTSRVSNVANGFGHISTTIDPNWKGALLIALSNPSNHSLRVNVGMTTLEDENGSHTSFEKQNTLSTLTFHYLCNSSNKNQMDYKSMRLDLLESVRYDKKYTIISYLRKKIYYRRKKYTDYFFDYLKAHGNHMLSSAGWSKFLDEFSKVTINSGKNEKTCTRNFIVEENKFRRLMHFINERKKILTSILILVAITIIFLLNKCNIIDKNLFDLFAQWLFK